MQKTITKNLFKNDTLRNINYKKYKEYFLNSVLENEFLTNEVWQMKYNCDKTLENIKKVTKDSLIRQKYVEYCKRFCDYLNLASVN